MATGDTLSFEAFRNQSGKYWCSAENGLNVTVNASAYLDVQCKYGTRITVFMEDSINGLTINCRFVLLN